MATISDTLLLDVSQPVRSFDQMEGALEGSVVAAQKLSTEMATTARSTATATREAEKLEDTMRELDRIAARSATEVQSIALAAGRADVNFEDLARSLNISESAARGMATEILQAQAASNRLEDSARDVARQLGLSEAETRRFASSLSTAARAADDINARTSTLVSGFGSLRSAAAGVAGAFAAIGLGNIFGNAIQGAKAAVGQFSALNESINAVRVTFGQAADTVLAFGERSIESAGLSAQAFQQAVVPIGGILRNFGFDAQEAADASIVLVQRAADLASVYNTDVATALAAINSALVGQVEPLRRYSAEISAARVEAFALSSGLAASKDELNATILTQARLGLILSDTARVQGDFVNTSEEFANASRKAGESVKEFGADVGEALVPALEGFLVIVPDILEGLRQLIPGFAAAADSANEFFQATNQDAGGFRQPIQAFAAGLGTITDSLQGLGDLGSFVFDSLTGEFSRAGAQVDQFNSRIARTTQRIGGQSLARELDAGTDSITAFGNALSFVGREQENLDAFGDSFRAFATQANLSQTELQAVTRFMIENATQAGLSAAEVKFLTEQLALLNDQLNGTDVGAQRAANRLREDLGPDIFNTVTTTFTTFAGDLESARTTITGTLRGLADDAAGQQARLAEALDPFAELPEQIDLSAAEATAAIIKQFEAIAAFEANIIRLADEAPDLALKLFEQGPAAATLVENFLNAPALAAEAESALNGVATAAVLALTEGLDAELTAAGLDQTTAAKFAALFTNPNVIGATTTGAIQAANAGTSAYRAALTGDLEQLIPEVGSTIGQEISTHWALGDEANAAGVVTADSFLAGVASQIIPDNVKAALDIFGIEIDLTETGEEAGITLITGMVIGVQSGIPDLRRGIEDSVRNSLEISSPSKVMMRLGEFAGQGLVDGFLRTANRPMPILTGASFGGVGVGQAGNVSNLTVNNTINHPISSSLLSDAAQLDQITGAAAAGLRAF